MPGGGRIIAEPSSRSALLNLQPHVIELAHFAVMLGLGVALVQALAPLVARLTGRPQLAWLSVRASYALALLVAIGAAGMVHAFLTDNFSVAYVAGNSNSQLPLIYKFTALWGGHEGSLYLWLVVLVGYTLALTVQGRRLFPDRLPVALAVLGALSVGFLGLILFLSNPFLRLHPSPLDGTDLNPLLQDPGMAIHPPMLYLGYVGFAVPYALAMCALLTRWDSDLWIAIVRRWAMVAWGFLTAGIMLGGWWAYYELGWGGYWAWDPVENASFMPWLTGTALLHSLMVQEHRRLLHAWNLYLIIATFALSLMGTFLVRSGILSSVHSFAVDPGRGAYILAFMALVLVLSVALYLWRGRAERVEARPSGLLSRETLLVANNVLFTVAWASVFIGTLYPLFSTLTLEQKLTVAAPFFNTAVVPLLVLLVVLMAVAPSLPWREARWSAVQRRWRLPLLLRLATAAAVLVLGSPVHWLTPVALGEVAVGAALIARDLVQQVRGAMPAAGGALMAGIWSVLRGQPRHLGGLLVHLGVFVVVIGMVGSGLFREQLSVTMAPGDVTEIGGHRLELTAVVPRQGPNYEAVQGRILLDDKHWLTPEQRHYPAAGMPTTEAAIQSTLLRDVYVVMTGGREGRWNLQVYVNPLVEWIWLGGMIILLGVGYGLLEGRVSGRRGVAHA